MKNIQTLGGGVLENNNNSKYNSNFNYNYNNKLTLKNSQGYNNFQNFKKYKTSENINQNKKDIQNQDILFTNNKDKIFHLKHQPNVNFVSTFITKWSKSFNLNSQSSISKSTYRQLAADTSLTKGGKRLSAFSLIELSIVLIIMGLLVAGITGGQSLIQSAKIRSFINEANNYRQAVNTFYTMNERLPGDENNYGNFCIDGDCSGTYAADIDFDKPFKDLYDASIIDFKAEECEGGGEGDDINLGQTNCNGINAPRSKAFKKGTFIFSSVLLDGNYLSFKVYYSNELSSKVAERIDQTIDDGKPGTGNVRAYYSGGGCGNYFIDCDDYNDAEGGVISTLYFKLDV